MFRRAAPPPAAFRGLTLALLITAASVQSALAQNAPLPGGTSAQLMADCRLPPGLPQRTRAVFVLDTSGSMRGLGDGKADIFSGVKASIDRYVQSQRPDRVDLLTFDSGVRSRQSFDAPAGSAAWTQALSRLKADGSNTHLYASIQAALSPLRATDGFLTTVYVLTDGIDNETPRVHTAAGALAAFRGRGPLDRLHYVALGTDIPVNARTALEASEYADGLTLPVGQLPALGGLGLEGGLVRVTDPARVPVPLPGGTPLTLDAGGVPGVVLARPTVQDGYAALDVRGVPSGTPALLCAPAATVSGLVAGRPQRVLLSLDVAEPPRLTWLNPGADLHLKRGEEVVLRYRAAPGTLPEQPGLGALPAGLAAEIQKGFGAREFAVRVQNTGLGAGQTAQLSLNLPGARPFPLPTLTGAEGGGAVLRPQAAPDRGGDTMPVAVEEGEGPRWGVWAAVLGVLGLLGLAAWRFRQRGAPPASAARPAPVPAAAPRVDGIEYTEARALSLITPDGESFGVEAPLGGPFDLGQIARVPHLSGLRLERHREGLHLLRVPADLEVSQGARLLHPGDLVRPGTLLGVAVARPARAPQAPLGSLAGLGLPLSLRAGGVTLHVTGPYGEHAVNLRPGVTDLGDTLDAPALSGLKFSVSGGRILLVEHPEHLSLHRPGEAAPLRPGTYLPDTPTPLDLAPSSDR